MKRGAKRHAPKAVIFSIVTLVCVVAFVIVNTLVLSSMIGELERRTSAAEIEYTEFEELYEYFVGMRTYLSITVNHDDIATVEEEFEEIRGALAIDDKETATIAKSRLLGALRHLGRLSGFNMDSII